MKSKYKAKKCEYQGKTFASNKEMKRFIELSEKEAKGEITNLQTQVPYIIIPKQVDQVTHKVLERETKYIADFVYDTPNGRVVEDTKGFRTDTYILKRKLMLAVHNIRIQEI